MFILLFLGIADFYIWRYYTRYLCRDLDIYIEMYLEM